VPALHIAQIGIRLCGTRIDMAERLLHHMALPSFKRLPHSIFRHVCVHLRRARVCMPHHPLHIIEALAVLGQHS